MLEAATRSCIQIFPSLGESIIFNPPKREFAWERKAGEFRSQELQEFRSCGMEELKKSTIFRFAPSRRSHYSSPSAGILLIQPLNS
jgi:hypothetical protein